MGHKVNPIGLRLGINRTWDSRWYANADYADLLHEDLRIRRYIQSDLKGAGISRITIERPPKKARVIIHTARPGMVIGKKGADIERIRKKLATMTESQIQLNIVEIRKPEIEAQLVAENVAEQLERRVAFRRAMKRAVQASMRLGALGIRITVGGRLGGAEIARVEWYREGRVPLHTLRADIDYGVATARTAYGTCGVKVWVFRGEILAHDPSAMERTRSEQQQRPLAGGGAQGGRSGSAGRSGRAARAAAAEAASADAKPAEPAAAAKPETQTEAEAAADPSTAAEPEATAAAEVPAVAGADTETETVAEPANTEEPDATAGAAAAKADTAEEPAADAAGKPAADQAEEGTEP
jgi:small subunit ribosomal protein S3